MKTRKDYGNDVTQGEIIDMQCKQNPPRDVRNPGSR